MRRSVACLSLLIPALVVGQEIDPAKVQIKVEKVQGSVYMLVGAGGNIGVSVGDDGIVIVDDQFAPLAPKIQAALKGIADKPVRFVINTHWHFDHVGANGSKVIPGHGKLSTVADLKPFAAMLEDALARVRKGVEAGKSADQLKKEKVLAGYESWSGTFISTDKFIDTLHAELSGNRSGEFQMHNR